MTSGTLILCLVLVAPSQPPHCRISLCLRPWSNSNPKSKYAAIQLKVVLFKATTMSHPMRLNPAYLCQPGCNPCHLWNGTVLFYKKSVILPNLSPSSLYNSIIPCAYKNYKLVPTVFIQQKPSHYFPKYFSELLRYSIFGSKLMVPEMKRWTQDTWGARTKHYCFESGDENPCGWASS